MGIYKITKHKLPEPIKKKIRHRLNSGFSVIEHAFLIAIVAAALIGMAIYLKRAISDRWRSAVDSAFGHGRQYDPYATIETSDW